MKNQNSIFEQLEHENNDTNVLNYINKYQNIYLPFYSSQGQEYKFQGANNISISARIFIHSTPKGKFLLTTGYNESHLKYAEFIMNLFEMGFSVYCFDHRGQGFSERFSEQSKRGYVDKFEHYINDLSQFFDYVSRHDNPVLPVHIIAHSMGGAISLLALLNQKITPKSLVLSAPMLEIVLGPTRLLELPVLYLSHLMCLLGRSKNYVFGQTDCIPFRPFEGNDVTNSKGRYTAWRNHIHDLEEMQLGGPTFGWMQQAILFSKKIRKTKNEIKTPILILQAEKDTVVANDAQTAFCKKLSNCNLILVNHAKHEVLMEADCIRNQVLEDIKNFVMGVK